MPFIKFVDLDDAKQLSKVPKAPGIYKVIKPDNMGNIKFKNAQFKDPKHNVSAAEAKLKYGATPYTEVLYIGKAQDLNRRLGQYVRFGLKKCSIHKGGRFIFTIEDWQNLKVQYIECEEPRAREKKELESFKKKNKTLPFANHRG